MLKSKPKFDVVRLTQQGTQFRVKVALKSTERNKIGYHVRWFFRKKDGHYAHGGDEKSRTLQPGPSRERTHSYEAQQGPGSYKVVVVAYHLNEKRKGHQLPTLQHKSLTVKYQ
jgi:hypothetical protein